MAYKKTSTQSTALSSRESERVFFQGFRIDFSFYFSSGVVDSVGEPYVIIGFLFRKQEEI